LSPKGDRFVVSHVDGQIASYNIADGSIIFDTPSGENGEVRRAHFYGDGARFVSVSGNQETSQSIQVRDAASGRTLGNLRGGIGGIESVAIHPQSGELVVTSASSATWAAPGHLKPDWNLTASSVVGGFFGGEDHFLAPTAKVDSQNGLGIDLALIQLSTGNPTWKLPQMAKNITRTSSDGKTAITFIQGSPVNGTGAVGLINSALSSLTQKQIYDANFQIFRFEDSAVRYVRTLVFCNAVRDVSLNPNGSRAAFAAHWNGFAIFDTATGKEFPHLNDKAIAAIYAIAWHGSDMKTLYSLVAMNGRRGHPDCQEWVIAWDTDTGQKIAAAQHATPMKCIASEPGGTRIAEAGDDKLIRIRDGKTLEVLREFRAHDGAIQTIAWNPAFPVIATGSEDRTIRLWDTNTGRMIEQLHIGLREPTALYFSPSGKRLACVIPGENTLIWELGMNQLTKR
jgi:WD40 repeat protein